MRKDGAGRTAHIVLKGIAERRRRGKFDLEERLPIRPD